MAILSADNVSYLYRNSYQTVHAVKEVSSCFESGCFYAIIGVSGSGKTTFLSLLAGLDIPSDGNIFYNGRSTSDLDRDDYRLNHVSVIYQNFNLFQHLTVLENTAYPLYLQKLAKRNADERAKGQLLKVGLTEAQLNRLPNMLSGGEQQRVAIARALTCGNEIILADEPTGNLDSENSNNIIDILRRAAHKEEHCVIVVTHDPSVADAADVVLKMQDGRLGAQ